MNTKRPSFKEISEKIKKQRALNKLEQYIRLDLYTLSKQLGKHELPVVLATATRLRNELDSFINLQS